MAWQTSTINPATTSPAQDISKIVNDLSVLKGVIGGTPDAAVPSTWTTALAALQQAFNSGTTGGTSTAYTLTPSTAISAYTAGMTFWVTFHAASGAAPTLQISGVASPPNLVRQLSDGTYANIAAGDIPANHRSRVTLLSATQALVEDMPPPSTGRQIQPITASVASNALTLTLNATSLDFRSSTLGSGAVNTRTFGSAISVVVPNTATLGTANATAARLAVLAIDNAGTVELAVVNLAGGNNLDETTLISTTAISAAATANNVIYSTAARTNVPFRLVGFVDITQATAGTWATAPSTIQGIGGQALAAMSSFGYGQTWQDVKASRAHGTTYTNTTGRPIYVYVYNSIATNGTFTITVNGISWGGYYFASGNCGTPTFIVPAGGTYSVSTTASLTVANWMELR